MAPSDETVAAIGRWLANANHHHHVTFIGWLIWQRERKTAAASTIQIYLQRPANGAFVWRALAELGCAIHSHIAARSKLMGEVVNSQLGR